MGTYRLEFERVLPRILLHARIAFRDVRCSQERDDRIADVVALSWQWWLRLRERGKNPLAFVSVLATYAARAVRSGRRITGQESSKDVLSWLAQARRGFTVSALPDDSNGADHVFEEALCDNTRTPVAEQVAFRCDFPAWLSTHTERSRRIIADLMAGERTLDVSRKHGTTPTRVSQLRREFQEDWHAFLGESV